MNPGTAGTSLAQFRPESVAILLLKGKRGGNVLARWEGRNEMATVTAGSAKSVEIGSTGLSRWWRVVGGLSMNLALGTLYAWSVFVAPLEKQFGWTRTQTSMAFTIAVAVFAITFVVAGRIQDKIGPLYCSLAGGVLVS